MKLPLLLLLAALPSAATETRWTATGTVTSVTGTGLAATVGVPVSVKFSYDSGATLHKPVNTPQLSNYTYYGPVQLSMEVSIGDSKWTSSLPVSPAEAIYAEGRINATDLLRVTVSDQPTPPGNGATFPLFPYTGTSTTHSMVVILQDNHAPSLFLPTQTFPDDVCNVSSISSGTGEIKAGTDSIKFSIDPSSVTVETGSKFPLSIETTATGVKLRWPTIEGQLYLLMESDDCSDWQLSTSFTGTGAEQVHEIATAFADHPARRFYKVVED